MSKENKYFFILTSWDDASRRSPWIYFRELPFDFFFFVGFSLMSRINGTKRGDFNHDSSPSAQWIQRRWSSAILCRELRGRETCAQRGRSIIKNSVGAKHPFDVFLLFFFFLLPRLTAPSHRVAQVNRLKPDLQKERKHSREDAPHRSTIGAEWTKAIRQKVLPLIRQTAARCARGPMTSS